MFNVIVKHICYVRRVRGDEFRHTMSTILHEEGFNTAWIETQLAHVDKNAIRGTYNHALYLEGRREMMQWYADYINSIGELNTYGGLIIPASNLSIYS
ncbi:tyrosine-type recombinase/integrase [Escherichia coli]|uniref:tyrosine-type recombinase/integrase n=1 Tax=Escherichia coli TaxID=562 RepID=UPI003CF5C8C2